MLLMVKHFVQVSLLTLYTSIVSAQHDLQLKLDRLVCDEIPGVVLLVDTPGYQFLGSAGLANLEQETPMLVNTLMPNGSAGKKLTALFTAMLHDEGMIDLDMPIKSYLPSNIANNIPDAESMSVRQLLNHTSGIFEYNDVADYAFFKAQFSEPDKLKTDIFPLSFTFNHPASFSPGMDWQYSNTGYALIGVMLENILGHHHAQDIRKKILLPLGMQKSFFKGIEQSMSEISSGYFFNDSDGDFPTPVNLWFDTKEVILHSAFSDAPLVASVEDLAKLLKSIVKGHEAISHDVRENMIGDNHLVRAWGPNFYDASTLYYGLGIFVEEINGVKIYHHGGTEFGYFTQNIYIPVDDISITAFVNCGVNDFCESRFQKFTFDILESFLKIKTR